MHDRQGPAPGAQDVGMASIFFGADDAEAHGVQRMTGELAQAYCSSYIEPLGSTKGRGERRHEDQMDVPVRTTSMRL